MFLAFTFSIVDREGSYGNDVGHLEFRLSSRVFVSFVLEVGTINELSLPVAGSVS